MEYASQDAAAAKAGPASKPLYVTPLKSLRDGAGMDRLSRMQKKNDVSSVKGAFERDQVSALT